MIFDRIKNLNKYSIPKVQAILAFIAANDCAGLPDGEIAIEGKDLFVRVMTYGPKAAAENKFETHQVHADVQYIARGIELVQVARPEDLTPLTDYDVKSDYRFYKADKRITDLVVKEGEFTVFYPGEPHRPSCLYQNEQGKVKKLVFKIRMGSNKAI